MSQIVPKEFLGLLICGYFYFSHSMFDLEEYERGAIEQFSTQLLK